MARIPPEEKKKLTEAAKLRGEQERNKNDIEREIVAKRRLRREPKYETVSVDYSKLKTVRIDNRTIIYIKPGECEEAARAQYYKNHNNKNIILNSK